MPYLEQEKTRMQAEVQAAATQISRLTAQQTAQQQDLSAAQARRSAAQPQLAQAQAQLPPLQAAAATADSRVADVDQAIADHAANEPDRTIEQDDGKPPRPNPAWRVWAQAMTRLTTARNQAQAESTAAHGRLNAAQAAVAQAQGAIQAAESQISAATAALQATRAAITAAQQRQDAAQQRLAGLERWQTEIARDPLDRAALEQVAAALSTQTLTVEEALTMAQFQQEEAEQRVASLVARRDQLVPMLNEVNGQLPAAQAELQAARTALGVARRNVERHVPRRS